MIFHIYIGLPQCLILPDGCANWSTCHHELFDQPQTNHHFMVFWWEDHCRETRGFKVCDFCTHHWAIPGCQFWASWRSPTGGLRRAKRLRRFVLEFMVRLPRKQYPRIKHGYCGGDIPEQMGTVKSGRSWSQTGIFQQAMFDYVWGYVWGYGLRPMARSACGLHSENKIDRCWKFLKVTGPREDQDGPTVGIRGTSRNISCYRLLYGLHVLFTGV